MEVRIISKSTDSLETIYTACKTCTSEHIITLAKNLQCAAQ